MREIKFRGKRNYNGEWVYGFYVRYSESSGYMFGDYVDKGEVFDIDPETVGQLTGLHDKNGKEIYEGDVVSNVKYGTMFVIEWGKKDEDYAGYICRGLHGEITSLAFNSNFENCEVIGNIHENMDLVNG